MMRRLRSVPTRMHDDDLESLKIKAALLETLAAASPLGMYMVPARSDTILFFNHRLCEMWNMLHLEEGMRRGEVLHADVLRHCATLIEGDALSPEACKRLWRQARSGSAEIEVDLRDGRVIRWLAAPIRNDSGQHIGMLFMDEDITARRAAERASRSADAQFRAWIEAAPDVIFVHREGRSLYANAAARAAFAASHPDGVDQVPLGELFTPVSDTAAVSPAAFPTSGPFEARAVAPDGSERTFECDVRPVTFEGAAATLVQARDVTERSRMHARLVQADRLAAVGTLAAGVAHEVNNPLAYVLLNLGSIDRAIARLGDAVPHEWISEMRSLLAQTLEGSERVRDIVRDLTTFSRPDDRSRAFVDVRVVLDSTIQMAQHEISRRARLVRAYESVAPVVANESRLAQVFLNLLLNAAHAIPDDGRAHEVHVRTRTDDHADVVVEIEDDGIGIPRKLLPRVFDPFVTTKEAGVGTGLGLAISQSIVRSLGGRIEIVSDDGHGTCARVVLPALRGEPRPRSDSAP